MSRKLTNEEWIHKVNVIHDWKYNYDKTNYIASKDKVIITCPIHGDFEQKANHHMSGHGCRLCANISIGNELRKPILDFINDANKIHNNKYDYSLVEYKSAKDKIKIICSKHGIFTQIPDAHINAKQGCPLCNCSKGEELIYNYFIKHNINFIKEFEVISSVILRKTNKIFVDFKLEWNNNIYFIEYDGEQHFKYIPYLHNGNEINFKLQQNRDSFLKDYCLINNINLVRFNYKQEDEEIIKEMDQLFRF